MKAIILFILISSASFYTAASDIIFVFQEVGQTSVVINEDSNDKKLDILFDNFAVENTVDLVSKDGKLELNCNRSQGLKSCTFKFQRSNEIEIDDNSAYINSSSDNTKDFRSENTIQLYFENWVLDKFSCLITKDKFIAEVKTPRI
jgi:hypothetical protein